jgi:hypothetical protein
MSNKNNDSGVYTYKELNNLQFYQLPKFLFAENSPYRNMSLMSKVLYSMIRDRFDLSVKKISEGDDYWHDERGVFIHFKVEKLNRILNTTDKTIKKAKKELETFGLIVDRRMGYKNANRIYLKKLNLDYLLDDKNASSDKTTNKPCKVYEINESEKFRINESEKFRINESENFRSNNTDLNNTDLNETDNNNRDYVNQEEKPHENNVVVVKEDLNKSSIVIPDKKIETSTISTNDLKELKSNIDKVIGTIKKDDLKKLVEAKGIDTIRFYMEKFKSFKCNKHNPVGFFIKMAKEEWEVPQEQIIDYKNSNKPEQSTNFEQRQYSDEYYESLYDNFKDKKIVNAMKEKELQQEEKLTEEEIRNNRMIEYYF